MIDQTTAALTGPVVSFAGSGLCGFLMGIAIKKILKWLIIIVGVVVGAIFLVIQYLINNHYIRGQVDWDKIGNATYTTGQHILTQVNPTNVHSLLGTLGIPVTGGLGLGLVAGIMRG